MVFAVAVVENIGRCWQSDRCGATDCVGMCGYLNDIFLLLSLCRGDSRRVKNGFSRHTATGLVVTIVVC